MVPQAALALTTTSFASEAMVQEPREHLTTTEARTGVTPHVTRYVLGWGLGLVVLIFLILLIVY
jgi:hypothetical protein